MSSPTLQRKLQKARRLLADGHPRQAADLCRMILDRDPGQLPAWRLMGRCLQVLGDLDGALEAAHGATRARPKNVDAALRLAECLVLTGDTAAAVAEARRVKASAEARKGAMLRTGRFFETCGLDEDALLCRLAALQAAPDDPDCIADLMDSFRQRDDGPQLEKLADRLAYLEPERHVALLDRCLARRQTHEDNHVRNLAWLLDELPEGHAGRIPLAFALAKEWEDLDHFDEAFHFLQVANGEQRQHRKSDIEQAIAQMEQIVEAFRDLPSEPAGIDESPGVIALVGLPGTGAHWLEQALTTHTEVAARGDSNLLALTAMRLGLFGAAKNASDPQCLAQLGEAYVGSLAGLGGEARWLLDRTADQHLYLGLMARALPHSRVIHLSRRPMDQAFSLFRRFFPSGKGWSHHLEHIARYVATHRRLMDHWRTNWPGPWLDLSYTDIADQPGETLARVAEFLDLEPASLPPASFNPDGPLAAQAGAVNRWKSYRRQLGPMMEVFKQLDVPLE